MNAGASRIAATAALALVALVSGIVLLGGDDPYRLTAQFPNAGRLVEGGDVRIAGRVVGTIEKVDLADSGLAEVTVALTEDGVAPLREGTRARIRAVGAATLTNNFVEVTPGPQEGAPLDDGAVLRSDRTAGIVDIDAILSSLDPGVRSGIRTLTERSADVFAGSGAEWFNGMLAKLSPALAELRGVADNLGADRAQLSRFVAKSADAAEAVASRRSDLTAAVEHTAVTLAAVDRERAALAGMLEHAPGALGQARRTLRDTASTLTVVRPMLRRVPPAARPAGPFLDQLTAFFPRSRPAVRQLNAQLPSLRRGLAAMPAVARPAERALAATARAFDDAEPILRGMRYYAPDFLIGLFNGLLTIGAGNYTKYAHYIHASFVQSPQDTLGGIFAGLLAKNPLPGGVLGLKSNFRAMCPGAAAPPAPDGSNDYVPDSSLCDTSQGLKAQVNTP